MTAADFIGDKKALLLEIAARHGAHDVRVFGSVARGEAGPESDLDLLVRMDVGVGLLQHFALQRELESLLGRKVDIVSERALRPRYRDRVLREALPL
jgi:hypothetical protein